jgi:hypothetical protein
VPFLATFFIACLAAIELEGVVSEDILSRAGGAMSDKAMIAILAALTIEVPLLFFISRLRRFDAALLVFGVLWCASLFLQGG